MTSTASLVRIWSDDEGESHFGDVELPLAARPYAPPAGPIDVSEPLAASRAVLSSMPAGWFGDWHPSPRRQLYLSLTGRLEVQTSDGEIREFMPGSIVLVEDVAGIGHTTCVKGDGPATGVFVHLGDGGAPT